MSLHITACDPDNPYGGAIASFLAREFPANLDIKPHVLDALTDAFVASGQIRQGPAPTPEVMVSIRAAIKYWMDRNEPIAVLVPWGSRKADDSGVDVAELGALRQLIGLHDRVSRVYAPGVHINLGIEDMGGYFLWQDDKDAIAKSAEYVKQFVQLVNILGLSWLEPVKETDFKRNGPFIKEAERASDLIYRYLMLRGDERVSTADVNEALVMLQEVGWTGDIPIIMEQHYLRQYERYYPTLDLNGRYHMLSRYLAQSFARYAVGIKLKYPAWGSNYVQVNFPQPVPGIPDTLAARRLYYRTLPMKFARTHIPAWRAKGHLLIGKDGAVTPKLTSVFDIPADIQPLKVELTDGRDTVNINADFVVEG